LLDEGMVLDAHNAAVGTDVILALVCRVAHACPSFIPRRFHAARAVTVSVAFSGSVD
jgi:hypothetical protein